MRAVTGFSFRGRFSSLQIPHLTWKMADLMLYFRVFKSSGTNVWLPFGNWLISKQRFSPYFPRKVRNSPFFPHWGNFGVQVMMCHKVLNLNIKERENSDFEVRKKGLPTLISSTIIKICGIWSPNFGFLFYFHFTPEKATTYSFYRATIQAKFPCQKVDFSLFLAGFSLSFSPVWKVSPEQKLRSKRHFFKSGAEPEIDLISPYVM